MLEALIDRIRAAHATDTPLCITGGNSKAFYGNACVGEGLNATAFSGVIDYQPKELVLTARAGTRLADIETLLAENKQMLAFEPPHFNFSRVNPDAQAGEGTNAVSKPGYATLGGCVATGLSGPRRPHAGSARDFVLGVRMIDGTGQPLRFGGQVIKNVAGYDVSRLMVGALGTLGLITEVSLKVLPQPAAEITLQFEMDEVTAIEKMNQWAGHPLPLSATSWHLGLLSVRLSGAASAVHAAQAKLGGEPLIEARPFWQRLRDQSTPFFDMGTQPGTKTLWRLAVKPTTPPLQLGDAQWIEWGGAVRWLVFPEGDKHGRPAITLRDTAKRYGGHAAQFRGAAPADGVFTPLTPALLTLHRNLKQRFDPKGIFNRGRLYPDF